MKRIILIGIFSLVVSLSVTYFIVRYSVRSKEVDLSTRIDAEQNICKEYFDKMFKIIQQEAKVADKYKESFKEIYQPLIEGRYKNDATVLMKWIQESNPSFNTSMYDRLMESIEAQREGFFEEQKKLEDLKREHDRLRKDPFSKLFLGDIAEKQIIRITSTVTEKVYKTGKEDNIELF